MRDTYEVGDKLIIVTTDRQSAFDRILASIPFKVLLCLSLAGNPTITQSLASGEKLQWQPCSAMSIPGHTNHLLC